MNEEQYERILEQHGDLEDRILREFCRLYNAGEYAKAVVFCATQKAIIKRRWFKHEDADIRASAALLVAICNECMEDATRR